MAPLKKIAVLLDAFAIDSPGQQLLDRFLLGYPRDGSFHRPDDCRVHLYVENGIATEDLIRRAKNFGLIVDKEIAGAVERADGIIVAPGEGRTIKGDLIQRMLQHAPRGSKCFIHGALGGDWTTANKTADRAKSNSISLMAGTDLPVTWRLPQVDLRRDTELKEALIVVQNERGTAELDGLEGLLPVIERRRGGESGVRGVRYFKGEDLWRAGQDGHWSWDLLAAAVSRSDSPQGDPVADGRTQDLVGLGLAPKLARDPHGWVIHHRDGLRSAILVLNGVVADIDFAVQAADGAITSAQIYLPPPPARHQFSALAAAIEDFFRSGKLPWPGERNLLIAGLLGVFGEHDAGGAMIETPHLEAAYSV